MNDPIQWWNLNLRGDHLKSLSGAFLEKKLSYGAIGQKLERRLESVLLTKHCLLTTSGSTSLLVALKALGVGPGDEVIVPNRTFVATANAVLMAGATVRLADVSLDRALLDPASVESLITKKTKVILPVHLNGRA
ncbi:MAG: aminotransferase class I/II-fold pyridoxal phosphate-dependent enzyme, partial [Bdellovibrionota bacterium]